MTTKEQEKKALSQIRRIVESLGEDSYIGIALEGCLELAAENIENDWGCSMKQRAESAEKQAEELRHKIAEMTQQMDTMVDELDGMAEDRDTLKAKLDEERAHRVPQELLITVRAVMTARADKARKDMLGYAEVMAHYADYPADIAFQSAAKNIKVQRAILTDTEQLLAELEEYIG